MSKAKSKGGSQKSKRKPKRLKNSKRSLPRIGRTVVKRIPRSKIKAAEYNPRVPMEPGDGIWEKLKASLLEFDLAELPVWNKRTGNLVSGHQRLRIIDADFDLVDGKLDVRVVDLSKTKEKALNIALNKIGGTWDDDKLAAQLAELKLSDDDILTGFEQEEVEKFIDGIIEGEFDIEPPEPQTPLVKLAARGANVSMQLGPDVVRQLDIDSKKNGSSRAGVARLIVEQWAKRRIAKHARRGASKLSSKRQTGKRSRKSSSRGKQSRKRASKS